VRADLPLNENQTGSERPARTRRNTSDERPGFRLRTSSRHAHSLRIRLLDRKTRSSKCAEIDFEEPLGSAGSNMRASRRLETRAGGQPACWGMHALECQGECKCASKCAAHFAPREKARRPERREKCAAQSGDWATAMAATSSSCVGCFGGVAFGAGFVSSADGCSGIVQGVLTIGAYHGCLSPCCSPSGSWGAVGCLPQRNMTT
jgi:hypothetical protein